MATAKLERLLDLIAELLHTRRPLTAEEIRSRIPGYPDDTDSFKRAFERDKADLRDMEIPLLVEPVPGRQPPVDGYRIDPDEYGLPDPGLAPDELAALHLAANAVRLDGTDAWAGVRKLGGAPGVVAQDAGSAVLPSAPHLAEVFDAVGAHRRLRFGYRGKSRDVDPLRLHHERGHWYLRGVDHGVGEPRSFRLDRIDGPIESGAPGSATVTEDPAAGPMQLDAWALGDDDPVEAVVRIDASQAALAARTVGEGAEIDWQDDGSVLIRLSVRRPDGLRSFVLGFLDHAELLAPAELRADLVGWLEGVAAGEG